MHKELYYRITWRSRGTQLGPNRTRAIGGNVEFQSYVPFMENPNPMRIDLRATLKSVPRQIMSRSYCENIAIPVYGLVDMSASMRFVGSINKFKLVKEICDVIAWSTLRNGDAFGLVASRNQTQDHFFHPATCNRGVALNLTTRAINENSHYEKNDIKDSFYFSKSALPDAASLINQKRALVFLISDFHLSSETIKDTLNALAMHDVVPLVIWDSAEFDRVPALGWANLMDMEGAGSKAVFLRSTLNKKIKQSYLDRRHELEKQCLIAGTRKPFFIEDSLNADALSQHLLECV